MPSGGFVERYAPHPVRYARAADADRHTCRRQPARSDGSVYTPRASDPVLRFYSPPPSAGWQSLRSPPGRLTSASARPYSALRLRCGPRRRRSSYAPRAASRGDAALTRQAAELRMPTALMRVTLRLLSAEWPLRLPKRPFLCARLIQSARQSLQATMPRRGPAR